MRNAKVLIKQLLALPAVFLGSLGVAGCTVGMLAVFSCGSRLSRANDRAFVMVEESLTTARNRVVLAQRRVQESRIGTGDIGQAITEWAKMEIRQEIASRLQVEERAEKLAMVLQQAGGWLETSEALIRGFQQALGLGASVGAPMDAAWMDPVSLKLLDVRDRLQEVTEQIERIRELAAASLKEEMPEDQVLRAIQMVSRVVVTLTETDSRLGEIADRLSQRQTKIEQLRSKTRTYILIAVAVVFLLLAWLAAGQAALCLWGYRNRHERPSPCGNAESKRQS